MVTQNLEVLNPVAAIAADLKEGMAANARPSSLEGKRIGMHWNRKPGGIYFLRRLETLLKQQIPGIEVIQFDTPAPVRKEVVAEIAAKCDVAILAQSD